MAPPFRPRLQAQTNPRYGLLKTRAGGSPDPVVARLSRLVDTVQGLSQARDKLAQHLQRDTGNRDDAYAAADSEIVTAALGLLRASRTASDAELARKAINALNRAIGEREEQDRRETANEVTAPDGEGIIPIGDLQQPVDASQEAAVSKSDEARVKELLATYGLSFEMLTALQDLPAAAVAKETGLPTNTVITYEKASLWLYGLIGEGVLLPADELEGLLDELAE